MPLQQYVVDVAREVQSVEAGDPDPGHLAYSEIGFLAHRRTGKSYLIEALVAEAGARGPSLALITAQTRDDAADRWAEIAGVDPTKPDRGLKNGPDRIAATLHATTGNSNEQLTFRKTGAVFRPFSPSEKAVHGGEADLVFVDELWWHSVVTKRELQAAYRPPWLLKDGQEWLLSAGGTSRSSWLRELRERGRRAVTEGRQHGLAYFECSAPESVRALRGDELLQAVLEHHPRRGRGLLVSSLRHDLENMTRAEFIRAYANLDCDDDAADLPEWVEKSKTADRVPLDARVSVGVAADPDRRQAAVVIAGQLEDGRIVIETVNVAPGVMWAAQYAATIEQAALISIANTKMSRTVADQLDNLTDIPVERVSQADVIAASGGLYAALQEWAGMVKHDGNPALVAAIGVTDLPSRGGFSARNGEPIPVLEAAALALRGLDRMPAPPAPVRPFRIL